MPEFRQETRRLYKSGVSQYFNDLGQKGYSTKETPILGIGLWLQTRVKAQDNRQHVLLCGLGYRYHVWSVCVCVWQGRVDFTAIETRQDRRNNQQTRPIARLISDGHQELNNYYNTYKDDVIA